MKEYNDFAIEATTTVFLGIIITMHSKSDNVEVITYDNLDEIIEKLFNSLLSRYQMV